MSTRIEDYALIGDCETAALVSRDGSIDWLCLPAVRLGGLLRRAARHRPNTVAGCSPPTRPRSTRIAPLPRATPWCSRPTTRRRTGAVTVIDFMPMLGADRTDLVRIVVGRRGLRARCARRSCCASTTAAHRAVGAARGPRHHGHRRVRTRCTSRRMSAARRGPPRRWRTFDVAAGRDAVAFVLTWHPSHDDPPVRVDAAQRHLEATERWWRDWAGRCTYTGQWREAVVRSLITLKALTYAPTGGIVAAPTTSLPEHIGGVRNWDYRYCWLRDATFTLYALMSSGYLDEARAWREWLLRAVAGHAGADSRSCTASPASGACRSWSCRGCPATRDSRPVRIGNAASDQFQLDVFGEVIDALHHGPPVRARPRRARLAARAQSARSPRGRLAGAGRGHLGGARADGGTSRTRR